MGGLNKPGILPSEYTVARAGYLDELAAANIPTDIGQNNDTHNGTTLFGRLQQLIVHIHAAQKVYPTLADGVNLTTSASYGHKHLCTSPQVRRPSK